jgi:hypothetical protein
MKPFLLTTTCSVLLFCLNAEAQKNARVLSVKQSENKNSYAQTRQVTPAVTDFDDVTTAHKKESKSEKSATQKSPINVWFAPTIIKYWADDKQGRVYRLSSSPDKFIYNAENRNCKISAIDKNHGLSVK